MNKPLRICTLSDTHGKHADFPVTPCDILIHCGDFSGMGYLAECKSFLEWFSKQPATHKIFICGNHDGIIPFEQPSLWKEVLKEYPGVTYLQNDGVEIEGVKIWGRPLTPTFNDWFWMADPESPMMRASLEIIPEDTDILITHGPPYQILDMTANREYVGSQDMRHWLEDGKRKPRLIVCGHIHHGRGVHEYGDSTTIVNCAVLNDWYRFSGNPTTIDFSKDSVKIIHK